jgi:hypothetical protein
MQLIQKILQIYKKNKWLGRLALNTALFFLVFLTFFYAFFFSLSDEKIKNFVTNSFAAESKITIENIEKNFCSIEIDNLQLQKITIPKVTADFCSFSFFFLQKIPITLSFEAGKIFVDFPMIAKQGAASISPQFSWNKLPIVSDYVKAKGNPFYTFTADYGREDFFVDIDFSAKDFIVDHGQIKPEFIKTFIPEQIKFDDLLLKANILEKNIRIQITSKGFFEGKVIGVISRNANFFQSKISFTVRGKFQNVDKLSPLLKTQLQPYLKNNALQMKLEGNLLQPQLAKI